MPPLQQSMPDRRSLAVAKQRNEKELLYTVSGAGYFIWKDKKPLHPLRLGGEF
jgi:hypothetical protein